jgi:hypothetical protein
MSEKFIQAIQNLRPNTEMTFSEEIETQEDFNKIEWVVSTNGDQAVLSTTNPHSELTWTAVKEEMDKL